jgi:hypothetical protein
VLSPFSHVKLINYIWRYVVMNMNFKLGKVSIPVGETKVEVEGLEIGVSDYNLMEGLKVLRELPSIMFELRQVMEVDLDDVMPSADEMDFPPFMEKSGMESVFGKDPVKASIDNILKSMGAVEVDHPIHGKGMAVPKDHPLVQEFLKHEAKQNGKKEWSKPELKETSLGDILGKMIGKAPKNPLESFLGGEINLGELGNMLGKDKE